MIRLIFFGTVFLFIFTLQTQASLWPQTGYVRLQEINGWQVQIDDSLYSVSDSALIGLSPGEHVLKIAPVNAKNWYFTVQSYPIKIYENDTVTVNISHITFQLLKQESITHKHIPQIKKDIYPKARYSFVNRVVRPGLIVTAIAANWASFYTKRKADEFYRKYQQTSELGKMNYYYDKTAEYDRYASVLLGVSAAALSTYLFFLLTN